MHELGHDGYQVTVTGTVPKVIRVLLTNLSAGLSL